MIKATGRTSALILEEEEEEEEGGEGEVTPAQAQEAVLMIPGGGEGEEETLERREDIDQDTPRNLVQDQEVEEELSLRKLRDHRHRRAAQEAREVEVEIVEEKPTEVIVRLLPKIVLRMIGEKVAVVLEKETRQREMRKGVGAKRVLDLGKKIINQDY